MTEIERERLKGYAANMTLEEQKLFLENFRIELIWNEAERRLKEAIDFKERLQKAMGDDYVG